MSSTKSISINYLPFPDEQDSTKTMQAGQFLYPGFARKLEPGSTLVSGKNKYLTGLEPETYPETEQEEVKQAKEELESFFGKESLDPYNIEFWKTKILDLNRKSTVLNLDDPEQKLKFYMIRGGAFQEIATSIEEATEGAVPKRWYLIDSTQYSELGVEDERKVNKAIAVLEEIYENKKFEDLFLMHKMLVSSDRGVTMKSPRGSLYKDLNDFIYGRIVKTNKKATARQFLEAAETLKKDRKRAYVMSYIKDGNYFHLLTVSEDNQIRNVSTGTKYGASIDKALLYLTNPANQSELENLKESVEERWMKK